MKNSKQRDLIKETVLTQNLHLTADEIYIMLKPKNPNLSLGTVYRNLNILVEQGFLTKLEIAGQSDKFDKILSKHDHFICEKCGKIIDIDGSIFCNLQEKINSEIEVKITSHNLILKGVCKTCKNKITI